MKATFKNAWPYQEDKMNLPVQDLEASIAFYEKVMGFRVLSGKDSPFKSAVLGRQEVQIGLTENGGDPSQEGCFIEVDDVEATFAEFKLNGLEKERTDSISIEKHDDTTWKVFYVVAPDGLCYCLGERQPVS